MNVLKTIDLQGFGEKQSGKVRDYYIIDGNPSSHKASAGHRRIIITTDRISAFDQVLGCIPYKGQVLNQLAGFWFEKTDDIIENHVMEIPDPNVTIAKNAQTIPIEMVVRGYITGVTGTSIWGSYEKGERTIYGLQFPDGLKKNQKLPEPVITPTTKAEEGHDERLTKADIITKNLVPQAIYEQMEEAALSLFARGTEICEKQGIILVDTKYEFGLINGKVILIDEIHTPDSSRFWIKETYEDRLTKGQEPENFDKEFLRIWFKNQGYIGEGTPPQMPEDFIMEVSQRYLDIYEKITGHKLAIDTTENIEERIKQNLEKYRLSSE